MTKSGSHGSSLREQLDVYKHAVIWDTRFSSNPSDHGEGEERKLEKMVDEFRREIPGHLRHSREELHQSRWHGNHYGDQTPIEETEEMSILWSYFCRQTTFHGVKNIVSVERRRYSRLLWFLLVLGVAVSLVYTVAILLLEYRQYNTVTKSDVKISEWTIFPSITMCNACPFKNVDGPENTAVFRLVASTSATLGHLFSVNFSDADIQALMKLDIQDVQNKYSYTADELFFSAKYENVDLNISEAFEVSETTLGRCFTFNGPDYIAKNGPKLVKYDGRESGLRLYVRLNQDKYFIYRDLTAGVRMFVAHHPDTPRLNQDGIDIHPGTSTRLALSPVQYTFLPAPYKSYGDDPCEETLTKDLRHKMVNATFYSYDNCLEQCLSYKASVKCSCYSQFLYVPNLRRCTLGEVFSCIKPVRANLTAASCDCPRPCTFTLYESTMSASQIPSKVSAELLRRITNQSSSPELREEYLEIRVYLGTMMLKQEKHEPQYTFSSIFAFLGGQMGFFMGASLVTLAELLEATLFSLYMFFNKKLMRMGQLTTNSQIKPGRQRIW